MHFRKDDDFDDIENALTDGTLNYMEYEALTDEEAQDAYAALSWTKAIIVNIDLPD